MTVAQAIKDWLYNFPKLDIDERISTELLPAEAVAYALSKSPNNIVEQFVDGSEKRTEYYTFFARQYTQIETERNSNDEFLEEFGEWVNERNFNGDLPILDNNRYCDNISVSSGFYLFETEENQGIYSFTIEIIYRKER